MWKTKNLSILKYMNMETKRYHLFFIPEAVLNETVYIGVNTQEDRRNKFQFALEIVNHTGYEFSLKMAGHAGFAA